MAIGDLLDDMPSHNEGRSGQEEGKENHHENTNNRDQLIICLLGAGRGGILDQIYDLVDKSKSFDSNKGENEQEEEEGERGGNHDGGVFSLENIHIFAIEKVFFPYLIYIFFYSKMKQYMLESPCFGLSQEQEL